MKVIILCLLTSVLFASCSSFFRRTPSSTQHIHYIMTLHGVRGNELSFGDFHSLIKTHLENVDPGFKIVPLNITYKTGQTNFTPHQAAAEINAKLEALIPNLDPADKISVLAYSMGGQVGAIWYFDSLKSDKYKKYPLQTVKFMSLGSPYWGSKEAGIGTSAENLVGQLDVDTLTKNMLEKYSLLGKTISLSEAEGYANEAVNKAKSYLIDFGKNYDKNILPYSKISFAELSALAVGSDVTNEIRLEMISHPTTTKWVSLSSLINCFKPDINSDEPGCESFQNKLFKSLNFDVFGKYTFGFTRRETDNSVITPSANANFIYAVETDPNYPDSKMTAYNQFRLFGNSDTHHFYLAEGLHATIIPEGYYQKALDILGVAGESWKELADDVVLVYEKDCKNPATCKHPAYKYIVYELADCDRAASTCDPDAKNKIVNSFFKPNSNNDEPEQKILKSELHGFTVEFNIRLPKGYDLSKIDHKNIFNYLQTNFEDPVNHLLYSSPTWPYKILLARPSELASLTINKVTHYANQEQLRVIMTGLITPKDGTHYDNLELEKGSYFTMTIKLPGMKVRKVQPLIRPYYSTYVDLLLGPVQ